MTHIDCNYVYSLNTGCVYLIRTFNVILMNKKNINKLINSFPLISVYRIILKEI